MENKILIGDNLDILKKMPECSVDLIYLDPPFFTQREFKTNVASFNDRWDGITAYCFFMQPRLVELHRVLKDTGSLFLHCDHRTNYRLRGILNKVFGEKNFRNEIIWCYENGGASGKTYSHKHDTIYFFSKTKDYNFYPERIKEIRATESLKRSLYKGARNGPLGLYRYPLDVFKIPSIPYMSKERVGWPTQKPLALLEKIIKGSSNEGDLVLDPFCGSGTTCVASYRLKRKWIGIDLNEQARDIVNSRLKKEISGQTNTDFISEQNQGLALHNKASNQ